VEAKTLHNLDHQIWSLFPSFCILPTDLAKVFGKLAQTLCMSIVQVPKLRPFICSGLISLMNKNKVGGRKEEEGGGGRREREEGGG
jgi:ribosomal RNA-processing protein 12